MRKTDHTELAKAIREKREQLVAIRAEVEDLIDYLEVIEARARDRSKPRLSHAQVVSLLHLQ